MSSTHRMLTRWVRRAVVLAAFGWLGGWAGFLGGLVAILVLEVSARWSTDVSTPCAVCAHPLAEHHGPCQQCLREHQEAPSDLPVPCARFRRGEVSPTGPSRRSQPAPRR